MGQNIPPLPPLKLIDKIKFEAENLRDNIDMLKAGFDNIATVKKIEFDAYIKAGFTPEQAIFLTGAKK